MKRRDFIATNAVAAFGLAGIITESCKSTTGKDQPGNHTPADFELNEITIAQLQEKMTDGEWTSETITQLYIERIKDLDQNGIALRSVIEVNPDAINIAKAMDEERKSGKVRGPMHGIPVLLKDNIDTGDKMMTTAGSLALGGHIAPKDAFLVKRLRDAGAVILGKTNLSEWANIRSLRSSSGWSSRGGQTKNPYVLDRSPCGSSSGSAVAVAANLCAVSVGTETDGSIACPASINGIVGIKPTVGLVSRSGLIPISKTQDTAGPFGRTVQDAAMLLSILAGTDSTDKATQTNPSTTKSIDYTKYLDENGLAGKRIGIEKTFLKQHEAIDNLLAKALEQLKRKGAMIVEVEFMEKYNAVSNDEYTVLQYEFKDGINTYLANAHAKVNSLEEVIEFNLKYEKETMPYFRQEIFDSCQAKGPLDSREYTDALKKCTDMRTALEKLMNENELDALCGPATGLAWCTDFINGDHWTGYGSYGPAAVAGWPSITVPMGQVNELPVGLSFFTKAYEEDKLIAIAYAYEQVSLNRKAPNFKITYGV
jgi:amidase